MISHTIHLKVFFTTIHTLHPSKFHYRNHQHVIHLSHCLPPRHRTTTKTTKTHPVNILNERKRTKGKKTKTSSTSMTSTFTTFPSSNCHHHIMNMFSNALHFQNCSPLFSHYYSHPNSTTAINTTLSIMTSTATQTQTHNTDVNDTET